jgi:class 3 adenylate cyclase/tetratricopeptide (TPR) repeat protein
MVVCSKCGEQNPEHAAFCLACGASLSQSDHQRETRKTVTILFCDVTGSTAMGERLDPESTRDIMTRYFDVMRIVIDAHGGTVEKFIGDAVVAVFGVPVVHEDDALRAVRAAAEMRTALAGLNIDLERDWGTRIETRIGINTGEVVAGAGDQTVATGDAINTAARLEQNAQPGEILIGEPTYRMVRHAVRAEPASAIDAKGKADPLAAYRLVATYDVARDANRRLDSPLIGRTHELQLAQQAFERAVRERSCSLFTVFGSPGVGKSRLVQELLADVEGRATVCRGRCLAYGRGITFWPLAEILRDLTGLVDDETVAESQAKITQLAQGLPNDRIVAERVAGLIGLGEASAIPEEAFWAVRKMFEAIATRRPLVIVFDDIQWAEPTLLDLIEHIADWSDDAPILLLCLARPELLEGRPGWGGGKLNAASIRLEPLREDESATLIINLLGGLELPAHVLQRIADASGGTPLFVEEMAAMLVDGGYLSRQNGSWVATTALDDIPIPATISALLAARLDRLAPPERRAIEAASVIGKEFWIDAVIALTAEDARVAARAAVMALVRKDIVRPDHSRNADDDAFQFRHILIRNSAYNAIPKQERARMHEAFAVWLTHRFQDRLAEYEEIVGYHLEQAFEARAALGPAREAARALARRASEALAAAGRRALSRGDENAGGDLLGRARVLLGDAAPASIMFDFARSVRFSDAKRAEALFAEAVTTARAEGDLQLEWRARVEEVGAHVQTVSGVDVVPAAMNIVREAIAVLQESGNDAGCADAWTLLAECHNSIGELTEMSTAAERAIVFARRSGDERSEYLAQRMLATELKWGRTPVADFATRAQALVESATSPLLRAGALWALAGARAQAGDFEEARRLGLESHAVFVDLGHAMAIATRGFGRGDDELLAGRYADAEEILRESCDALARIGEVGLLSTLVSVHGQALLELGRIDEAEECSIRGEQLSALDDLATQVYWRSLRARVRARQGRFDEAIALAREAVSLAESTQALLWQADSLGMLAEVLEAATWTQEALDVAREALARYERKGVVPRIARTRDHIARLEAAISRA